MKIILIGATGTIGEAITEALRDCHQVIPVSRNTEIRVDYSDPATIKGMYDCTGKVDAVISVAGNAKFGPLEVLTRERSATTAR